MLALRHRQLAALGNLDAHYEPAYVEDLDIGYRAWQRGWPSVYVAGAIVEHRHRATTSRYYTEAQLGEILERNYLRFVARAVSSPAVFRRLWRQALRRLFLRKGRHLRADRARRRRALGRRRTKTRSSLTNGTSACSPAATGRPRVVIASPHVPFRSLTATPSVCTTSAPRRSGL